MALMFVLAAAKMPAAPVVVSVAEKLVGALQ